MRAKGICIAAVFALALSGCGSAAKRSGAAVTGGDPDRGSLQIAHDGCGSCHIIPGVAGAHGLVGPSLAGVGSREYIAGVLENTPPNLEQWIEDPHAVNGQTVMPNVGLTPQDATDITAYLYSLR
jgi:cytochrome c1